MNSAENHAEEQNQKLLTFSNMKIPNDEAKKNKQTNKNPHIRKTQINMLFKAFSQFILYLSLMHGYSEIK